MYDILILKFYAKKTDLIFSFARDLKNPRFPHWNPNRGHATKPHKKPLHNLSLPNILKLSRPVMTESNNNLDKL